MQTQETSFPSSGDPRVDAALKHLQERNDGRFKDLEDAMLIHAHLEAGAARRIKEHAELIAFHHENQRKFEENQRKFEENMRQFEVKMLEIEGKIDFIVDREMRREGGPEAR